MTDKESKVYRNVICDECLFKTNVYLEYCPYCGNRTRMLE